LLRPLELGLLFELELTTISIIATDDMKIMDATVTAAIFIITSLRLSMDTSTRSSYKEIAVTNIRAY
jgi:hypothetical protein